MGFDGVLNEAMNLIGPVVGAGETATDFGQVATAINPFNSRETAAAAQTWEERGDMAEALRDNLKAAMSGAPLSEVIGHAAGDAAGIAADHAVTRYVQDDLGLPSVVAVAAGEIAQSVVDSAVTSIAQFAAQKGVQLFTPEGGINPEAANHPELVGKTLGDLPPPAEHDSGFSLSGAATAALAGGVATYIATHFDEIKQAVMETFSPDNARETSAADLVPASMAHAAGGHNAGGDNHAPAPAPAGKASVKGGR